MPYFHPPITLIVWQVALIAAAGIVLYFLARHYLSVSRSVMIVASYYGANGVIGPTLGNFYEHCQIPLFIFSLLLIRKAALAAILAVRSFNIRHSRRCWN
jgi:uncharacterized membrane protein